MHQEYTIRIINRTLEQNPISTISGLSKQKKLSKSSRKRLIRYSILAANVVLLIAVLGFVVSSPDSSASTNSSIVTSNDTTASASALDEISSADIAVHVANLTKLYEAPAVTNNADTVNAQLAVTPADDTVVAKPQVVATTLKSYKDIQSYVTVSGDTIPSIAAKFGVTSDTIRWSNGLQGDNVTVGRALLIAPVNGIVYIVKAGDTIDSVASKYKANKEQLIADNDAEATGLVPGTKILIRDGSVAPVVAARSSYSAGFSWGGGVAVYGANGYDYGYCTWYAANKRAAIGRPVPSNLGNASTWKVLAQRAGFAVGSVPQSGAVIWTPPRDYYGHVGFVEAVNPDGSVLVSEMNTAGFAVRSTKTLSAAEAARYSYIY